MTAALTEVIKRYPPDAKPVGDRESRRACFEDLGWGLTRDTWAQMDQVLDEVSDWPSEERRAVAEMILVGIEIGTNCDRIARVTGLNRDKFIRPKAKLLRASGIWVHGKTAFNPAVLAEDAPPTYFFTELICFVLVAEGLIEWQRTEAAPVTSSGEAPA